MQDSSLLWAAHKLRIQTIAHGLQFGHWVFPRFQFLWASYWETLTFGQKKPQTPKEHWFASATAIVVFWAVNQFPLLHLHSWFVITFRTSDNNRPFTSLCTVLHSLNLVLRKASNCIPKYQRGKYKASHHHFWKSGEGNWKRGRMLSVVFHSSNRTENYNRIARRSPNL